MYLESFWNNSTVKITFCRLIISTELTLSIELLNNSCQMRNATPLYSMFFTLTSSKPHSDSQQFFCNQAADFFSGYSAFYLVTNTRFPATAIATIWRSHIYGVSSNPTNHRYQLQPLWFWQWRWIAFLPAAGWSGCAAAIQVNTMHKYIKTCILLLLIGYDYFGPI